MGMPDFPAGPPYIPDPPGVREIRLGDAWLARWSDSLELPEGVPVSAVYASVMMDGKGYVVRPKGTAAWRSVEGTAERAETGEAALKRLLMAQIAATIGRTELVGFLDCRATSFNPAYPAGAASVQPVYLAIAKTIGNMPANGEWERRRLPLNEHIAALRLAYPQFEEYFAKTVDRYAVLRARGEA
jgi:hypothetical protein